MTLLLIGGCVWCLDERIVWIKVCDHHVTVRTMLRLRQLPVSELRSIEIVRRASFGQHSKEREGPGVITVRSTSMLPLSINERALVCMPGEVSDAIRRLLSEQQR
jgi:hypothetical protein